MRSLFCGPGSARMPVRSPEEVSSVPVGHQASRAPPPPRWLWQSSVSVELSGGSLLPQPSRRSSLQAREKGHYKN